MMIESEEDKIRPKALPRDLTSYDFLKAAAVIIMVIDHIGYYFYPDHFWFRAIGRIGFPIWFFLIGYASGRSIPPKLWGGALLLILGDRIAGMPVLPLNALFTIIALRLVLDQVMRRALISLNTLAVVVTIALFLIWPSEMATEYGTQALLFAMFGFMVRHRDKMVAPDKIIPPVMGVAVIAFLVMQCVAFPFNQPQQIFMCCGTLFVTGILLFFKAQTYPELTVKMPRPIVWIVQLMGRRTLEIYVAHLLLFKAMGVLYFPERFELFHFAWAPLG